MSELVRCDECGAKIPLPDDLEATKLVCRFCGAQRAIPDLETRQRALLAQRREAAERRKHEDERIEREAERQDRRIEQRTQRRGNWATRLTSVLAILLAPAIISVTVFDLPARLGFGSSGAERVAQVAAQLAGSGCTTLVPATSTYATGTVSQLATVDSQCIRVLAAGGDGHRSLSLRLFSAMGRELAQAGNTSDPQLYHCPHTPGLLRYEIGIAPAAKGRLTHTALRCPVEKQQAR